MPRPPVGGLIRGGGVRGVRPAALLARRALVDDRPQQRERNVTDPSTIAIRLACSAGRAPSRIATNTTTRSLCNRCAANASASADGG